MMPNVDFRLKQQEFVAYIRDPDNNPVPLGLNEHRMKMYHELFFNNIDSFLSGNFPVLRALLNDAEWQTLARDFFKSHKSETPYFSQIPEEFLSFLEHERDSSLDFPFLLELAHYEWVEMALSIAQEEILNSRQNSENLLNKTLSVSPLAWVLAYAYPVHKISPEFLPVEPPEQPSFLIAYRNTEDKVHFIEITPMTYRLLQLISENNTRTVETCLQQIVTESHFPNPEQVIDGGLTVLKGLLEKNILMLMG